MTTDETTVETSRSWSNPLVIAILTASLAGFCNICAVYLTSAFQREANQVHNSAQRAIELSKADSTLILEMIKTDPSKARINLQFVLDAGLLGDAELSKKISKFLQQHPSQTPSISESERIPKFCKDIAKNVLFMIQKNMRVAVRSNANEKSLISELKWDEIDLFEVVQSLEEDFPIIIDESRSKSWKIVSDIIDTVKEGLSSSCPRARAADNAESLPSSGIASPNR